jgi:hypothetical protein
MAGRTMLASVPRRALSSTQRVYATDRHTLDAQRAVAAPASRNGARSDASSAPDGTARSLVRMNLRATAAQASGISRPKRLKGDRLGFGAAAAACVQPVECGHRLGGQLEVERPATVGSGGPGDLSSHSEGRSASAQSACDRRQLPPPEALDLIEARLA